MTAAEQIVHSAGPYAGVIEYISLRHRYRRNKNMIRKRLELMATITYH